MSSIRGLANRMTSIPAGLPSRHEITRGRRRVRRPADRRLRRLPFQVQLPKSAHQVRLAVRGGL